VIVGLLWSIGFVIFSYYIYLLFGDAIEIIRELKHKPTKPEGKRCRTSVER
jgi:hypothetical protein